ncbi:MAG TPA: phasin family protein [Thermoanaerobaculia bacterium]|jgi:poly(hydroxyalkanoate) granule-associated protein
MSPTKLEAEKVLDSSKPLGRLVATGKSFLLAGVGAVAEVREGGIEMFDRLVERGKPLEAKRKQAAGAVVERATKAVRGAGQLVQDTVEFESRGLLKRMNVMTREDVKVLSARITTLSKKVDEVVARRHAAAVEIVTPAGMAAAVVVPVPTPDPIAAAADLAGKKAKATQPSQRKITSKG